MIVSKTMPAFRALTHSLKGRSIHIPSSLPRRPPITKSSRAATKDIWQQTRLFVNRVLFGGTGSSQTPQFARSFHSIRSQLSLPARHALANPLGSPFLARPPALQRGITQVGLGTARNFGTARPIFQAIAENVPVTARAAYEMDWDLERKRGKARQGKKLKAITHVPKTKKVSKIKFDQDYEKYFTESAADSAKDVSVATHLTIPLVPQGAENISPSVGATSKGAIVPRKAVSDSHGLHGKHAKRINSLFLRLDQAKVWERGAHYEAFGVLEEGGRYSGQGTCTTINVIFEGWTREMVLGVIGEAGKGWCVLKEVYTAPVDKNAPMSLDTSLTSLSTQSSVNPGPEMTSVADHEFIMPTLDFSSSFIAHHSPEFEASYPSRSHSPFVALSDMTGPPSPALDAISLHSFSDNEHESSDDEKWHWSRTPSSVGSRSPKLEPRQLRSLGFSAEFMSRGQEYMNPF